MCVSPVYEIQIEVGLAVTPVAKKWCPCASQLTQTLQNSVGKSYAQYYCFCTKTTLTMLMTTKVSQCLKFFSLQVIQIRIIYTLDESVIWMDVDVLNYKTILQCWTAAVVGQRELIIHY